VELNPARSRAQVDLGLADPGPSCRGFEQSLAERELTGFDEPRVAYPEGARFRIELDIVLG
jgi:hypothetical protein